jgi:hypothetical protein
MEKFKIRFFRLPPSLWRIDADTLYKHPVVRNKSILHEIRCNKAEDYSICRYMRSCGILRDYDRLDAGKEYSWGN